MAHAAQFEFIERIRAVFPGHFEGKRILEVGSLNINGSVRQYFQRCDYTGIDVAAGSGVDDVCGGQVYDAAPFDTVLSCEAMEHNPFWAETLANMVRLCKPSGLILMTCATSGRPEHGTTRSSPSDSPLTVGIGWEYYRNLTASDVVGAGVTDGLGFVQFFTNWRSHDLYMVATKTGLGDAKRAQLREIELAYRRETLFSYKAVRNLLRARLAQV